MKNSIEKIEEKIDKNTEYTIMLNGKWQKFAFISVLDNGRLSLLNTKYGTLTKMSASFFIDHINPKKYKVYTRPYNVENPDETNVEAAPQEKPVKTVVEPATTKEKDVKVSKEIVEMNRWELRLKTLPPDINETLEKELQVSPRVLGENLEKWGRNEYKGSVLELYGKYNRVRELLKGTEWYVK